MVPVHLQLELQLELLAPEELEQSQWALAARRKEEDNLMLLKYTKADESKLKELNLQLEKMVAAVQTKRVELETEVTDTQSKQEKAKNEQENAGFCAVILCWGCVFHVCG
jgi:hypothetical protein